MKERATLTKKGTEEAVMCQAAKIAQSISIGMLKTYFG